MKPGPGGCLPPPPARRGEGQGGGLVAAFLCALTATAHADPARHSFSGEAGAEVDSNVHRVLSDAGAAQAGLALRAGARWAMAWRASERTAVASGVSLAARGFPQPGAAEQSTLLGGADLRFEAAPEAGTRLAVAASYLDLFDEDTQVGALDVDRDFRTGLVRLTLGLASPGPSPWRVTAGAGARLFQYKPDRDLDFAGALLQLEVTHAFAAGEDATLPFTAGYSLQHRAFRGEARVAGCGGECIETTDLGRVDLYHTAGASLGYAGSFLAELGYELGINDSNSVGQSFVRHRFELTSTLDLGRQWVLTGRLVLQVNRLADDLLAGPLGEVPTIEDESKSAIHLHILRPVSRAVAFEARAAHHRGPFGSLADFQRTVVYLGLLVAPR